MAASHSSEAKPRTVRIAEPPTPMRLATWGLLVPMLRDIFRQLGIRIEIIGAKRGTANPDGGASFEIQPGTEEGLHAWKLEATTTAGNPTMTVNAGSHNGVPVAKVEELDEGDVYFKVTWNPTINDGYVAPNQTGSVSTLEIIRQDAGDPAPSNDTDTSYIEYHYIGTVDGGVVTAQVAKGPISTRVCDDGTSTSVVQFIIDDAGGYS